ncbi:MAG TPA: hypothetical protein VEJ63_05880 [Planctomycetota bacterium]|nr:hypothetical protein [Planctomycetota bacterium]
MSPVGDPESAAVQFDRDKKEKTAAPQKEFQEAWNALGAPFPKIEKWTDKRQAAFRLRWADEFFRQNWRAGLERLKKTAFCRGENQRGWVASVEFFLRPDKLVELIEGKYEQLATSTDRPGFLRTPEHKAQLAALSRRRTPAEEEEYLASIRALSPELYANAAGDKFKDLLPAPIHDPSDDETEVPA